MNTKFFYLVSISIDSKKSLMLKMLFVYFEKHSQQKDYLRHYFFVAIFKLYIHNG
jgi:hypothetical protein